MKTSSGALNNIKICKTWNLKVTIELLKKSGLQIVACTEKTENKIYNTNYVLPTALVLGSEENGISSELLKMSDKKVKIPIYGKTESLNVSVASGVILYEVLRQRNKTI